MTRTFAIDFFVESIPSFRRGYGVIVIDVIRATTTAITAAATGRKCFVVDSLEAAYEKGRNVPGALLIGELSGEVPPGFQMNNSPAALTRRTDVGRPVVLLSSAGSKLMHEAASCDFGYAACFRNYSAMADYAIDSGHDRVAIIGAGTAGEVREEDAICCALIGGKLLAAGFEPKDQKTRDVMERWGCAEVTDCLVSASVRFLERSGQLDDLQFILGHIDDLESTFTIRNGQVIPIKTTQEMALAS